MATTVVFLYEKIPWTEEPGGLQSNGLQGIRHIWVVQHSTVVVFIEKKGKVEGLVTLSS